MSSETVTNSASLDFAERLAIHADIAASFTYASYQNAIPVLRSIRLANATGGNLQNLTLDLTADPAFLRPKTWTVDRLLQGDEISLSDRRVDLDPAYLGGLNEAERGRISLVLKRGAEILAEERVDVRLLARDEWGGVHDMAQLLPAFVMPNDPSSAGILRQAADHLAAHGHSSGLDGYQSGSPQRAFLLTAAIYSAITGMGLHYAEPPTSFEQRGQKVRRPSTIETERLATCLDTSLLFAAALEGAGLYPVVLLFRDHAAVGVWLTKRTLSRSIELDAMEIRKALASRELLVFETTGVSHRPAMPLDAAQRLLERRLDGANAQDFVAAIDVHRARSGGITPLASHEPLRRATSDDLTPVSALPLPAAPDIGTGPAEIVEIKPTTAAGRIDRWQRKLLDLTLRNRLLNFAEGRKTIPFLCADAAALEDILAGGTAIRLISLPEQNPLGERDPALYREVHGKDLQQGFAAEALKRGELPSPLSGRDLDSRLIELHRQSRNDLAEGGANTLFLAVGFLRWKKKTDATRFYRAPLLLVPVKLERRSASSAFSLRFHEDEPRFNATLLQFLEGEFDLRLPQFNGELPMDANGVDVPRLLTVMRQAVRDVPGMEVVDETALSTFSFAKFLMWKDLVERTEALRENRVVRHLIDTPEQAFAGAGEPFAGEASLDKRPPADVVSLLPADSSQTAASLAAAEGRDFVIIGPPGTGKSQTIANMIANCLATGKSVLFVAEKTAALDVVYRRLREHGLGDHCIELHSSKADRRNFLGQLKTSWEKGTKASDDEWVRVNEELRLRRDELNRYVTALHKTYRNGLTPYAALGLALRGQSQIAPKLAWSHLDAHDHLQRQDLERMADEVGLAFRSIETRPALHLVDHAEWTSAWQADLLARASDLGAASDILASSLGAFLGAIGFQPRSDAPLADIAVLGEIAHVLIDSTGYDLTLFLDPDLNNLPKALAALEADIAAYAAAHALLSANYDNAAVQRADLDTIDAQWREAQAAFWPKAQLDKRKAQKLLQTFVESGTADPDTDLPGLLAMQARARAIAANPLATKPIGFAGLDTDTKQVAHLLTLAGRMRRVLSPFASDGEAVRTMIRALDQTLRSGAEDQARQTARRLVVSRAGFDTALAAFSASAGSTPSLSGPTPLGDLQGLLTELPQVAHLLRDWTSWCRSRQQAIQHGLGPLVTDLEAGMIQPDQAATAFKLAYARWWAPLVLDTDPVLRDFRRFQHEHAIADFREIDDIVRAQATQRVLRAITHGLPAIQSVPRNSELGLLRHQMELQRPSRSIREMIGAMPENFGKLAPCILMSPLSIAQYLPPNQSLFDVVIFDEASQITTWDAVGAIARARQTIVVGDPKQLPPTNFFGRNEEDEEVAEHEKDLESILDEVKASGIPVRDLRWHYRSRNESLIAFSNHHYYQNRLVTFPSPHVEDRAVQLHRVAGTYDRGKSRSNRIEGQAIVDEAVGRLRASLALPEGERPTLGVITFNAQQQSLIQDLFDAARRDQPELEWFFAEDRIEPVIVKNLENVQGDERDVILFSITFSEDAAGKRSMDFGALNRDGGERRLNVAVTRARQELLVFSGFTADQIDVNRTKALGVRHLKAFLDFAERGAIALPAQDKGSVGALESPFEEAVAAQLEARGWEIVPQVGISGFRVDMGIRDPDRSGTYLAGVECDGATYHSSATARDRDKVREQVLRGLGWTILRVWSTDWWFDPAGAIKRLHTALTEQLETVRAKRAETEAADAEAASTRHWDMGEEVEAATETGLSEEAAPAYIMPEDVLPEVPSDLPPMAAPEPMRLMEAATPVQPPAPVIAPSVSPPSPEVARYHITDLSAFPANPDRFYEFDYRGTLKSMVDAVIAQEAPLRDDVLAQRIARAHGWQRTGQRIRARIDIYLRDVDRTEESSGTFLWRKDSVTPLLDYRPHANEESRRGIGDIAIAELASVVIAHPDLFDQRDPASDLARLLGVERLAASSRTRLDEAIARARQSMHN
ncbi:AAA domain-containing protein [Devosia enhydra]|uniref:AAA domain-containing protein n=1 Tax=Devosia enhydra TaxID=665118 RepID=A0A1K2HZI2_9HYPH|nr:DUF3320 domain-containing protein [Devosia enhydra]SFZ84579.1 AAA domain-containing protein [Devosia enhydra]